MQTMTRALFAGLITGLLSTLAPSTGYAACVDADRCSRDECVVRQAAVHPNCDIARACKANMSHGELVARRLRNLQCINARTHVQECFSAPDAGHQTAIAGAVRAMQICDNYLAELG